MNRTYLLIGLAVAFILLVGYWYKFMRYAADEKFYDATAAACGTGVTGMEEATKGIACTFLKESDAKKACNADGKCLGYVKIGKDKDAKYVLTTAIGTGTATAGTGSLNGVLYRKPKTLSSLWS